MADFSTAFNITKKYEGAFSDNPSDKGGETWCGISRTNWPDWPGWHIVDQTNKMTIPQIDRVLADNQELEALVGSFYIDQFWNVLHLGQINCQQLANQLFDIGVNMGLSTAGEFLQKGINALGKHVVVVDKIVGQLTITAANQQDCAQLYDHINKLRYGYYTEIVANDPSQKIFEEDWLKRILPFNNSPS